MWGIVGKVYRFWGGKGFGIVVVVGCLGTWWRIENEFGLDERGMVGGKNHYGARGNVGYGDYFGFVSVGRLET